MRHRRPFKMHYPFFPLFFVIAALGIGLLVKFLWNHVLVDVLAVRMISYWQAVGLLVLCRILFGNFGGPGGRRWGRPPGGEHGFNGPSWRNKWRNMTQEEREKFREELINRRRSRFGR